MSSLLIVSSLMDKRLWALRVRLIFLCQFSTKISSSDEYSYSYTLLQAVAQVVLQVKCPLPLQHFNQNLKQWVNFSRTTQVHEFWKFVNCFSNSYMRINERTNAANQQLHKHNLIFTWQSKNLTIVRYSVCWFYVGRYSC
jgi:hypothetical protein